VAHVIDALGKREGGWLATLNVDIFRAVRRDAELAGLIASASLIVPDGMPLLWAARPARRPAAGAGDRRLDDLLAQRRRADAGRSVYLLGGAPGVPEWAGTALAERYPGLIVAGADAPPMGFRQGARADPPGPRQGGPRRRRTSSSSGWASRSRSA